MQPKHIWIFSGSGGRFPGGAFERASDAELWITKHQLTGVLTQYPVNLGTYDWAVENGFFKPKKPHHSAPELIGSFSCAYLKHYHYEGGVRCHPDEPTESFRV